MRPADNKRGTRSAMAFEMNYEKKLLQLGREIAAGTYTIGRSICFICFKPLQREIFAADFRDRIIHHLIYNYINPIFERSFLNDSYSCRIGKGTSYGIKTAESFYPFVLPQLHAGLLYPQIGYQGLFHVHRQKCSV